MFNRKLGSATRKRFSYANVAATLALFLALTGGSALAAHVVRHYLIHSTSQITPGVLKALHGKNGKNGANGTNGTNGLTGPTGATGASGLNGTTGFTSTLPAGKTEEGTWAGNVQAATSPYYIPLSFDIPLAATPTYHLILAGGASTAACPGTVAAPQAASGNFCVYEAQSGIAVNVFDPNISGGSLASADVFGAVLALTTGTSGAAYGTWAVTA